MKFIKKHKSLIVVLLIVIIIIIAFFLFKDTVMFEENQAIYGDRCAGSEKVKVTKEQEKQIKESIADITKNVIVSQKCKIINIIVYANAETTQEQAKSIGDKVLPILTDEQKQFFDIQFLIENEENDEQFPISGYMHQNRDVISWTKDRAKAEG